MYTPFIALASHAYSPVLTYGIVSLGFFVEAQPAPRVLRI